MGEIDEGRRAKYSKAAQFVGEISRQYLLTPFSIEDEGRLLDIMAKTPAKSVDGFLRGIELAELRQRDTLELYRFIVDMAKALINLDKTIDGLSSSVSEGEED